MTTYEALSLIAQFGLGQMAMLTLIVTIVVYLSSSSAQQLANLGLQDEVSSTLQQRFSVGRAFTRSPRTSRS